MDSVDDMEIDRVNKKGREVGLEDEAYPSSNEVRSAGQPRLTK